MGPWMSCLPIQSDTSAEEEVCNCLLRISTAEKCWSDQMCPSVRSLPETHLRDGSDGCVRRGGRLEEHVVVDEAAVAQLAVGGDIGVDAGLG